MLSSAILRALPQIKSGLLRIDPHGIHAIRNQVGFAGQPRHPETVVGIGRGQRKVCRRGMRGSLTGTCSSFAVTTAEAGIAILPPELMADDGHVHRILGLGRGLGSQDDAGCAQEEHDHNENGNDRPGKLDLVAAVDLRRFVIVARAAAEAYKRVKQQSPDGEKNAARHPQRQHGEVKMECAGVAAGAKMLVGACAGQAHARRNAEETSGRKTQLE